MYSFFFEIPILDQGQELWLGFVGVHDIGCNGTYMSSDKILKTFHFLPNFTYLGCQQSVFYPQSHKIMIIEILL